MNCRRILLLVLVLVFAVGMPVCPIQAAENEASGVCGDNLTWTFSNGVLTISGNGVMTDTSWNEIYYDKVERVVVEEGVTGLGYGAFSGFVNLTSAELPSSLESIPHSLFRWCEKLERIEIPASVKEIGSYAFQDCTSLKTITIPDSVKTIAEAAFWGCTSVETVDLGNGVENIEDNAFLSVAITEITIPASVKKIKSAFTHCGSLNKVVFEGDAPSAAGAFSGMRGYAYYPANNATWTFDTRASIGGSFSWVEGLPSDSGTCGLGATWSIENGILTISGTGKINDYYKGSTPPWRPVASEITKIVICEGITEIGFQAFGLCTEVRQVILPDGLEAIGDGAFAHCAKLSDVTLPEGLKTMGEGAFEGCASLTKVTIPASVRTVEMSWFLDCTSLKEIVFAGDAPSIGATAFAGVTLTVWYPTNNSTWTETIKQTYSGNITWREMSDEEDKEPPLNENPPTEPEPQPTEPDPTDPTEPQPTEPDPTDPTEPQPTELDPTAPTESNSDGTSDQTGVVNQDEDKPVYWIWGMVAGVAAIGLTVVVVAKKRNK